LEHTRYGVGHTFETTNEKPVPNPLYKPLTITNSLDKHDFKPPYKTNWWDGGAREPPNPNAEMANEAAE
jgi:hypothetical protein